MSRIDLSPIPLAIGLMVALTAGSASAQSINLTGVYRCVQVCRGDLPAHITQNGPELNLLTESGAASRAWPDWFSPANRIWVDAFNESAVFSRTACSFSSTMGPSGTGSCRRCGGAIRAF